MLISKKSILLWAATVLFVLLCSAYFLVIGDISDYPRDAFWSRPGNIHDHFVYAEYGNMFGVKEFSFMDNNFGMYWIFSSFENDEVQLYAHLLNVTCIIISSAAHFKLCYVFNLPMRSYMLFFLNLSFLYFSILINKDSISIAIILVSILFAVRGNFFLLLVMIAPSLIVRQQLAFFIVTLFLSSIFLCWWRGAGLRQFLIFSVVILSVASVGGAVLLQGGRVMSAETLGSGVTGQIMAMAREMPILAPLTVPIRVLLYVYDMYSSFLFAENGMIDVAKVLRVPALLYIATGFWPLFRVKLVSALMRNSSFYILALGVVCAFASILFNPQINARYATIILPVIILVVTCCRNNRRWVNL